MSWDDNTESEFEIRFEGPNGSTYREDYVEDEFGDMAGNYRGEAQGVIMTGGRVAEEYEKDFFAIYDKARQYRMRLKDVEKRTGDEDQWGGEEKKKRVLNPTMKLMSTIAKKLQESGAYPDINRPLFMRVAKMIVDKAKEDVNAPTKVNSAGKTVRELTSEASTKALQLTDNTDTLKRFIEIVRSEKAEKDRAKGKGSSTTSSSSGPSSNSNSRSNRNLRDSSDGNKRERTVRNTNSRETFEKAYGYPSKNTDSGRNTSRNSRGASQGSDSRYRQLNRYGDEGYPYEEPNRGFQTGGTAVFY